ncbi:6497_t:CDS:1, partial [Gigaspora margarita]
MIFTLRTREIQSKITFAEYHRTFFRFFLELISTTLKEITEWNL